MLPAVSAAALPTAAAAVVDINARGGDPNRPAVARAVVLEERPFDEQFVAVGGENDSALVVGFAQVAGMVVGKGAVDEVYARSPDRRRE